MEMFIPRTGGCLLSKKKNRRLPSLKYLNPNFELQKQSYNTATDGARTRAGECGSAVLLADRARQAAAAQGLLALFFFRACVGGRLEVLLYPVLSHRHLDVLLDTNTHAHALTHTHTHTLSLSFSL